ncbi:MAG: nitronate monooxygenase [Burkholderiaceae bacterium]
MPIIQAPMAGVQNHALAIAVAGTGAIGSLPCATLGLEALQRELASLAAHPGRLFSINFFCHRNPGLDPAADDTAWRRTLAPYYDELGLTRDTPARAPALAPFGDEHAEALEALRPAVVSFTFGLPEPALVARVKRMGARVLAAATTVDEGRWLEAHGADAVIAQGIEAGGHRALFLGDDLGGQRPLLVLLDDLVATLAVPIVAAGGIASPERVRTALEHGAAAVQIGTSYLLCPEASTSPVHRAALAARRDAVRGDAARGDAAHRGTAPATVITNLFTGRPARAIDNRLIRELGAIRDDLPPFPLAANALAPLRARAEANASGDFSPLWSGEDGSGCEEIPAADLTRRLAGRR